MLLMSLVFYGAFEIKCILIILVSVFANYGISIIFRKKQSKIVLFIGISFDVLLLVYFKYLNFIISNINKLFSSEITVFELLVPIGISFITFQQISYIVDTYRDSSIRYTLMEYLLYATFFPYVISGPIVRHNYLIPQLHEEYRKHFNDENFAKGLYAFSMGMGKKVLIADTFAKVANIGFNDVSNLNTTTAIVAMLSYTIQIYFDFSGYSDMVIGVGKMLNFDMPINFNSPYKAINILDFWKRWHISLTSFLTEYIYFPLGGNRKGKIRTYFNVLCVFLISGLWHGASWTYIIWGMLHGMASVLNRIFKKKIESVNPIASWIVLFLFVNFTWIFFRASSVREAVMFVKTIGSCQFGPLSVEMTNAIMIPEIKMAVDVVLNNSIYLNNRLLVLGLGMSVFCLILMKNTSEKLEVFKPTTWKVFVSSVVLVWSITSFSGVSSFIYVNF